LAVNEKERFFRKKPYISYFYVNYLAFVVGDWFNDQRAYKKTAMLAAFFLLLYL